MIKRGWAIQGAILVVYLAGRIVVLCGGEVFTSHDSAVYAPRPDPSQNHGPLVSFTGHAPRVWGVPLFNSVFSTDHDRAVGQWALGTLAWALLALAVTLHLRSLAARAVGLTGVLAIGLLTTVASWDFAILSESLSLSLGAVTIGFLLIWLRYPTRVTMFAVALTGIWWTFVRPDIVVFVGAIAVCLVIVARAKGGPARWQALTGALALVFGIAWYVAITPTINETFPPYSGTSLHVDPLPTDEEQFLYRLRVDVFTDPALKQAFHDRLGMPNCPGTDSFATRSEWDFLVFTQEYRKCPELMQWGETNKGRFWPMLLTAAPAQFFTKVLQNMSQIFGGDHYAKVGTPIPPQIEKMVFPSWRYGLAVVLIGFVLSLGLAVAQGTANRNPVLLRLGLVIGAVSIASALLAVFAASGEYRRFGIQETVAMRLAMVVFIAAAIDSAYRKREGH